MASKMVKKSVKEWDLNCKESYPPKKLKRKKKETKPKIKKRRMLKKNKIKNNLQKLLFLSLKSNATEPFKIDNSNSFILSHIYATEPFKINNSNSFILSHIYKSFLLWLHLICHFINFRSI